ncbi:MAG: lysylphosphatidylglycerol synthase transmembrane domain-containing protein [Gaiellales bacterium]
MTGLVVRYRGRLATLVGLGVAVVTFGVVLPKIADYREVWRVVQTISPTGVAVLLGAIVLNVLTFAPPWMVALPGLGFRRALAFTQASTAVTYVVPGGGLVGMAGSFALLKAWAFPTGAVARAVTLTGIWNQLSNLLLPIVAVALLAAESEADAGLVSIALLGGAIFAVATVVIALVLWRAEFARAIGELAARVADLVLGLLRRGPVRWGGESLARFQVQTVGLLRRRWHVLTLSALGGTLAIFFVLLVCVRAVGTGSSSLTWIEIFAGWSIGRILGLIPLTPGGVGVVELGLSTALVGFGGDNAEVVAAVLLYRVATIVPTLALGGITMLVWRRIHPDRLHPPAQGGLPSERGNLPE